MDLRMRRTKRNVPEVNYNLDDDDFVDPVSVNVSKEYGKKKTKKDKRKSQILVPEQSMNIEHVQVFLRTSTNLCDHMSSCTFVFGFIVSIVVYLLSSIFQTGRL